MYIAKPFLIREQDEQNEFEMQAFQEMIEELLPDFFSDKPLFKKENISLYFYDEYVLNTCVTEKSVPTLYLEINQPDNVKKWIKKKNRHTYPELYTTLNTLRDNLFEYFVKNFDDNSLLWQDKYGINFSLNLYDEDDVRNINFRLVPCITYINEKDQKGIMYFNEKERDVIIDYPKLSIKNFKKKNKKTLGIYKEYCVIFKNIFKAIKNEKVLPSEIFETILYNVPDFFFENYTVENLSKIITYIRNSNVLNYLSMDEQDFEFVTAYRPMNLIYVKHVIKKIEGYVKRIKK